MRRKAEQRPDKTMPLSSYSIPPERLAAAPELRRHRRRAKPVLRCRRPDSYSDAFAVDDSRHRPAGAIAPDTVEQIQAIVRVAAEHRIPLWPISRGKNLGYGGSAPVLEGSVILDLSRMKKIEYDEENGTVLLEPGVGSTICMIS
jgi:4-cresol dehydrogenase (hydroxylating)